MPKQDKSLKFKEGEVKFIKKVAADKSKLLSQRDGGKKSETVKTLGHGCVPVGFE
jgi:hypothetical protein